MGRTETNIKSCHTSFVYPLFKLAQSRKSWTEREHHDRDTYSVKVSKVNVRYYYYNSP